MKNKGLAIAIIAVIAVLGIVLIGRSCARPKTAKKTGVPVNVNTPKAAPAASVAKTFSKGMGGLTVKVKNSTNKPQYIKTKAFMVESGNSSVFVTAFGTERMQILPAGTYDIEIDTIPVKIYKNISVSNGRETVKDLGTISGSINVKALNSKKKGASVLSKVLCAKTGLVVTTLPANRPTEIMPGVYDVEIDTLPRQVKKDIKVSAGQETVIDLGIVSGSLLVKAIDANGKEARLNVRIKNPSNNQFVTSSFTNKAIEVGPGAYDVEVLSSPAQVKNEVKINPGEETIVEIAVQAQSLPEPAVAAKKKK